MKSSLLLFIILISGNLFAQTTRRTREDSGTKDVFYVLKSDKSIKEGPYKQYTLFDNKLICEGFYKNNLKDSVWKYYSFLSKIYETGSYEKDKKTGIWEVYNFNGERELQYDYTNKKVLFFKSNPQTDTLKFAVINGIDTINAILDRPPIYLDGMGGFYKVLGTNIRYPREAKEHLIQGKVIIAFTVDTLGKTYNYRVKRRVGFGCDEEALRVVKLVEGDWLPGILKDKPVTCEYIMPISFTLQSQ